MTRVRDGHHDVLGGSRGPLLVLALVLAAAIALLVLEHRGAARGSPALGAPAESSPGGRGALPASAPAPAR